MKSQIKEKSTGNTNTAEENEGNISDNQLLLSLKIFITNPDIFQNFKNFITKEIILWKLLMKFKSKK